MLSSMDSRELSEWMVYLNIDNWREYVAQKNQTDKERSDQIKSALFKRVNNGNADKPTG